MKILMTLMLNIDVKEANVEMLNLVCVSSLSNMNICNPLGQISLNKIYRTGLCLYEQ